MTEQTIEYECECGSCQGTGIYVGIGERDGAGVVCLSCKGTGHQHVVIKYQPWGIKRIRNNVKVVYRVNPGICIGAGDGHLLEDFGGMGYTAWLAGQPFPKGSEDRAHTCPAWFYQSADYKLKPNWQEGEVQCQGIGSFSGCQYFDEKHKCWTRFDKEQA